MEVSDVPATEQITLSCPTCKCQIWTILIDKPIIENGLIDNADSIMYECKGCESIFPIYEGE